MDPSQKHLILSFCGGGMRGLMSIEILKKIRNELHDQGINWYEQVDCFAGCSTGSLIAGGLVTIPLFKIDGLIGYYETFLAKYFKRPKSQDGNSPGYSESGMGLEKLVDDWSRKLSAYKKKLVIPSFSLMKDATEDDPTRWGPVIYNNVQDNPATDPKLLDAVLASCAMPGMVAPHQFVDPQGKTQRMVDGGFANHDPSLAAVSLALQSGVPRENIRVVCIGTGFMENYLKTDAQEWGANQWIEGSKVNEEDRLPGLLYGHNQPTPVLNMLLNGTSTNHIQQLVNWILPPENVAYVNPSFGTDYVSETAADKNTLAYLRNKAANANVSQAVALFKP